MRTVKIKVFKISELSPAAQENAHNIWLGHGDTFFWNDEYQETLKAFEAFMPLSVRDWSVDSNTYDYTVKFSEHNNILELSGVRLAAYIWNHYRSDIFKGKYYSVSSVGKNYSQDKTKILKHPRVKSKVLSNGKIFNAYYSAITLESSCPLTGVCMDDDIIKPLLTAMESPDSSKDFEQVMRDCLDNFFHTWEKDIESSETLEYFLEHADANEYEYHEDGTRF